MTMRAQGRKLARLRAAMLGLAAVGASLAAVPGQPASAEDERAALRADYERDLALLRTQHQKALAEVRAETLAVQRKADILRRMVPAEFDAGLVERRLQALAQAAEVGPLDVKHLAGTEKVRQADGGETPYERHLVDVAGQDRFASVGFLLDRVGRLPLAVELVSLSLEARPGGAVRFTARLGFPTYRGWPETPPPAVPAPTPPLGPYASTADERAARQRSLFEHRAYLRRLEDVAREPIRRAQAEVFAVAEMKKDRAPARFHAALARFEAGAEDRLVAFHRARFDARTVIEGVAVGAAARDALRPAFETAGFVIDALDVAPAGDCLAFSLSARLAPPEDPAALDAPPVEVGPSRFRARSATSCGAPPQPAKGHVAARGTNGELTVTVRDIDVADVFQLLATLAGASFAVDADVKGRVGLDLERATLESAAAAMGAAGVTVGPGPLRRVRRTGHEPDPPAPPSAESPVSLFFKHAVLLDVVRLFQEISGRQAWTAPVMDGRVTIFATDVPWDAALRGIASSVGMTVVMEDERFFVGPADRAKAPWASGAVEAGRASTTDDDPGWGRIVEISKVSPEDLTPLGLAHTAEGTKGIAYGPGRVLWVLADGVELLGARVESVGPADVTFVAGDGRKSVVRFAP